MSAHDLGPPPSTVARVGATPPARRSWLSRRRVVAALGVLAVLGAATPFAISWVDSRWPYHHFRTVQEGAFYRSGQLTGPQLENAIDRYGIKTVVNLRAVSDREKGDWYGVEKETAARKGVLHLDVPCGGGQPPNEEQIAAMLRVFDDPANRPVLVHCEKGTVRSAAAEALWRMEYMGESGPVAFSRMTTWGRDFRRDYPLITEFVLAYVPRRARPPPPSSDR